jgi:hypothetical protein
MKYEGPERRKFPRISGRFIVSYRIIDDIDNADISQTKNIGLGGMLITTNRQFESNARLALEIRLPFDPDPIILTARVIESKEITKNLIYDTRLMFLSVDYKHRMVINETIDYYLKKG